MEKKTAARRERRTENWILSLSKSKKLVRVNPVDGYYPKLPNKKFDVIYC